MCDYLLTTSVRRTLVMSWRGSGIKHLKPSSFTCMLQYPSIFFKGISIDVFLCLIEIRHPCHSPYKDNYLYNLQKFQGRGVYKLWFFKPARFSHIENFKNVFFFFIQCKIWPIPSPIWSAYDSKNCRIWTNIEQRFIKWILGC